MQIYKNIRLKVNFISKIKGATPLYVV